MPDRDELPGLQGRHRYSLAGRPVGAHSRRAGHDQLRRAAAADDRRRPGRPAAAASGGDRRRSAAARPPAGSCITVVVTDAPLDSLACSRLARRAGLGLARTGSTGTTAAARSSSRSPPDCGARREPPPAESRRSRPELDPLFDAVVEATEEAVLKSLLAAPTVTGRDGNTSPACPRAGARTARRRGPDQLSGRSARPVSGAGKCVCFVA